MLVLAIEVVVLMGEVIEKAEAPSQPLQFQCQLMIYDKVRAS